jgi:hypothetical protein
MKESRFVVINDVNLGRLGNYRIATCQYCGATAAARDDSGGLGDHVAATFRDHHEHASARMRHAA